MKNQRVAVIGAGSWGTALAKLLGEKGKDVTLWSHRQEHAQSMAQLWENTTYLPGAKLPNTVTVTADINTALIGNPVVVMVVPSHVYREVFQKVVPFINRQTIVVSATKGIENDTLMTMTQVMGDVYPTGCNAFGVLSGPSFAREVADNIPTAVTVGSTSFGTAAAIQDVFFTERFRVYSSNDVVGIELGGPLKNVVAIAAGICDGLGYGTNTRAALITRGLAEITRIGVKMGANPLTFSGLAGLGDLVLTCTGDLSRNRQVGILLGKGRKLTDILSEMNMVAEGVKTTQSAWRLAQREGVDMPILEEIYKVIYQDKPCSEAVTTLLARDQKEELA